MEITIKINYVEVAVAHNLCLFYIKPLTKISTNKWINFFSSVPKPCLITQKFNLTMIEGYWSLWLNLLEWWNFNVLKLSRKQEKHNRLWYYAVPIYTICWSWSMLNDPSGSNHLSVVIKCLIFLRIVPTSTNSHKIWQTNKTNWRLFEIHMEITRSENCTQLLSTYKYGGRKSDFWKENIYEQK